MEDNSFFKDLTEQYDNGLPFVAYSLPNTFETKAILQKDDVLYKIEDYTETGFVFAPFDIRKDAILMPYSKSRTLVTAEDIIVEEETPLPFKVENDKLHHLNLIEKAITAIRNEKLQKVVVSRKEILETADKNEQWVVNHRLREIENRF
mgnify:CR=1 FL=1